MANQDIKQNSSEGKFLYAGMNVHLPSDLQPKGKTPYLFNVDPDLQLGTLSARPGTTKLYTPSGSGVPYVVNIASTQQTPTTGYTVTTNSDGSGTIYNNSWTVIGTFPAGTFSNAANSIVHYRPPNSPSSYAYIFDSKSTAKVYVDPTGSSHISGVGLNPGVSPPAVGKADVCSHLYAPDSTSILGGGSPQAWVNNPYRGGIASAFNNNVAHRDPGGITIAQVMDYRAVYGWIGPICIVPTGAPSWTWLQVGSTLYINESGSRQYCYVDDVFPTIPNDTVGGIIYDNSSSAGLCVIQLPNTRIENIRYGRLIQIGSEYTIIQSVSQAEDDSISIRVSTASHHNAGETVSFPFAFSTSNLSGGTTPVAGQTITSYMVTSNLTYSASSGDQVATFSNVVAVIPTPATINNCPLTNPDDYIHWSFQCSNPLAIDQIQLLFSTDPITEVPVPFQNNYWYINFIQGSLTPNLASNQTTASLALSDFQNTLLNQSQGGLNQLPSGSNQWFEIIFRISDLTQVGTADAATINNLTAVGITIFFNANVTVSWGSIWTSQFSNVSCLPANIVVPNIPSTPVPTTTYSTVQGGPDSNWNAYGYQGTTIQYRYRYRDQVTGALSNVSPATRYGINGRRSVVFINIPSNGIVGTYIDIERFGGTVASWRRCLVIQDNVGGGHFTVIDNIPESDISSAQPLELDQYVPFATLQQPVSGTLTVVGTSCVSVSGGLGGAGFSPNWVRGTNVIINSRPYNLYTQPNNASFMELDVSTVAPDQGTFSYSVPEPLVAGTPLPYADGPFDGRVFACGDSVNPGYLYFTNIDNADTCAGDGYIEVCGPDESLIGVAVYEGALFVLSTKAVYRVEPTPGQANPYAPYKLSGSYGLAAPGMMDFKGPVGYYGTQEGLVKFGLNGSTLVSWADLRPLFPFDGHTGVPVVNILTTLYPVDFTAKPRVTYAQNKVYIDYRDTQGANFCLVYDSLLDGFQMYQYAHGSSIHYLQFGVPSSSFNGQLLVCGITNPGIYAVSTATSDNLVAFTCACITPSLDQGATRNNKNYYDVMVDYILATEAGATPPSISIYLNNYTVATPNVPYVLESPPTIRQQQSIPLVNSSSETPLTGLNIGSAFQWLSTQGLTLFEWQPSYTVVPVAYTASPYDYTDGGTTHYKWVQGLRINANTYGANKNFQVYYDADTPGPTFTINTTSSATERVFPISFNPPFKSHLMRLVPVDSNPCSVYSVEWIYNIEPDVATHYQTQPTSLGLQGFGHAREFELAYAAVGTSVFSVIVDGVTYTFYTDSVGTGGTETKVYVPLPPLKGKLWSLSYTGIGLQVYEKDCEFRVKQWASSGMYQNANIAGDDSLTAGAKI